MDIITKEEAIARGMDKFFTGVPCRNGHMSERYVSGRSRCLECKRLAEKRWYDNNHEEVLIKRAAVRERPNNKAYMSAYISKRWEDNKEEFQQYNKEYYVTNKTELLLRNKEHREQNKASLKEQRIRRYATKNGRAAKLWSGAKHRAKKLGLEFNIELSDVIIPEACPVFGIPIMLDSNASHLNRPSLDRIDNTKGYIKGNVCVISNKANTMKSNMTLKELKMIEHYMLSAINQTLS